MPPYVVTNHDKGRRIPPDPTQRVLQWGGAYPCLMIKQTLTGWGGMQCGGLMLPSRRCFRDEDGRLWRSFKCNRCGRKATDWKAE